MEPGQVEHFRRPRDHVGVDDVGLVLAHDRRSAAARSAGPRSARTRSRLAPPRPTGPATSSTSAPPPPACPPAAPPACGPAAPAPRSWARRGTAPPRPSRPRRPAGRTRDDRPTPQRRYRHRPAPPPPPTAEQPQPHSCRNPSRRCRATSPVGQRDPGRASTAAGAPQGPPARPPQQHDRRVRRPGLWVIRRPPGPRTREAPQAPAANSLKPGPAREKGPGPTISFTSPKLTRKPSPPGPLPRSPYVAADRYGRHLNTYKPHRSWRTSS